jgi:hypothetical protein
MQDLGDVIVCCLIQLLVGHIHLNKHLDRVSPFRKVIGVHGLFSIAFLNKGFYYICHFM